jgi:hypothetical protein
MRCGRPHGGARAPRSSACGTSPRSAPRGGLWRVMAISALDEMVNSAHASDEMVYCAPTGVAGADGGHNGGIIASQCSTKSGTSPLPRALINVMAQRPAGKRK